MALLGLGSVLALLAAVTVIGRRAALADVSPLARLPVLLLPVLVVSTFVLAVIIARQAEALQEGPTTAYTVGLWNCTAVILVAAMQLAASVRLARTERVARWRRLLLIAALPGAPMLAWFLIANGLYWTPR